MGSMLRCVASLRPFKSHPTVPGFLESAVRVIDCVLPLKRLAESFGVDRLSKITRSPVGSFGHRSARS